MASKVAPEKVALYRNVITPVVQAVCAYLHMPTTAVFSKSKDKTVVLARSLSMYYARKHTELSYPELGAAFDRDHTSVRSTCQCLDCDITTLPDYVRKCRRDLDPVIFQLIDRGSSATTPEAMSKVRPRFEDIYMRLAIMMAERSTCVRLAVGCVITSTDYRYVYGVGYNGNASGLPNTCDRETPGSCGCVHAETNAVINCRVPRDTPKVVLATHLPCEACAKNLINLGGVKQLYYRNDYRIKRGLELLDAVGISYQQIQGGQAL